MLITFTETRRMSEDGFAQKRFETGKTYDVADTCARVALQNRWAHLPLDLGKEIFNCFRSGDPEQQLKALNELTAKQLSNGE